MRGRSRRSTRATHYLFSSILGEGREIDVKFLVGTHIEQSGLVGQVPTDDSAWASVFRSFEALAEKQPPIGPFAPNTVHFRLMQRGYLVQLDTEVWGFIPLCSKAEGKQQTVYYGLPSYNSTGNMCWCCPADRSRLPFTNMHRNSPWRGFTYTRERFLQLMTQPDHPLARSPFMTRYFFV